MDEIRQVLSKASSPWVLLALKQDALVKRQLDDQAFRIMAIERIGSDASGWSPAALAFLALKLGQTPRELRDALRQKPDSLPIPEELRQRANAVLENLCQSPVQVDLAQAGLLALAIYDRYSRLGDWDKVFAELVKECPAVRKSPLGLAAYACLFGFVPDTLALIRGMLLGETAVRPSDRSDFISRCEAAIYAVLTQPFTLQEQLDVFQSILKDLTAGARLQFLRALNNRRTSLAAALAGFILSAFPESIVKAVDAHGLDSGGRENFFSDPLGDLERINYSIEIYRIANQPEATERLLKLAQEIAQNLQSNLVTQLAYTATRKDDAKSALESLERNKPQSASDPRLQAMLALNLMDNHHYADAASILKKQPVEPCAEWLLAKARYLRYKNEIESASHTALQALEAFAQRSPAAVMENGGKTGSNAQIAAYIRQLADLLLNLPNPKGANLTQVQRAAELSLIYQPEDPKGLCLLAQTQRLAGYTAKAVETASLAAVLAENDVDVQRVLAQTLESAGEWESALEVWKGIIYTESPTANSGDSPLPLKNSNPSDLRAYAICALNMEQPALVLQPLQQVLEMNDQDGQAHIMLANACFSLAKSADLADGYLQAIEHYRQAIRLEPANRLLFRNLSESCAAAGMGENALDAARQALSLAPAEVENILWFARQAMALHAPQETIDTLNWAMKLHSQEVRLKAVLAQANRMLGNEQEALVAYEAVLDSPNDITLDDLLDTGRGLLALGKTDKAIFALERARQNFPTMGEQASFDLLALLTEAYQTSGNILAGIQAAEGALSLKPQNASLWKRKADMYLQSDQPRPALISLERAIELDSQDYEAHRQAMEILRLSGNLAGALEHARKMAGESTAARAMAAAFVNEMLEPDLAFEMCQGWEQAAQSDPTAAAQLGCLKAELELASGKDEEAVQTAAALDQFAAALTQDQTDSALAMSLAALQSRLAHRRKNGMNAASAGAVELSLPSVADPLPTRAGQSLAEAALELGEWDKALVWSQQVVADMPIEPLPYLNLARAYILRAENQRICRVLAVKQHAPGEIALAEESHQAFSSAIKNAAQRASETQRQRFIQRWEVRGAAVFDEVPSPETLNILANLISDAGDAAACTAAFTRLGDVSASVQAVQAYAGHSLVLLQNALAFLPAQPRVAMETALLAIERWKETAQPVKEYILPLIYALAGLSARQAGESETTIHTLQQALALWQDEAEWHKWLADLYAAKADWLPVIEHLEKTIALADESSASLNLAQAYLNANLQPERAVGLLSSILEKNPGDCEAQAFLAEALMQAGQSEQALAVFRKVFESPLAEDPAWRVRLALGMAQAALQTGQTAAAVSVLQDVAINVPEDGRLFRSLSESYAAAGLVSGAMDAARRAFELAPQDLNTLLWFSEQAMKLQRPAEAAEALVKAVKKNPQAMSLYIRLAKAHMLAGNRQDALATLKYVRVAPGVQFADLLETALCLLDMDEPAAALVCLERARAEIPVLTNEESLSLLNCLVKAFLAKGDPQSGLAEAEKILERMPESAAQINKLKADLYLQSGNPQQALACIELVLSAQPEDGGAHRQAMEILRISGDLPGALEHARKVAGKSTAGRLAAAEFSLAMLEDDLAYDLAADVGDSPDASLIETLKLKCLKAELDLNKGNQEAAGEIAEQILVALAQSQKDIPASLRARTLALKARLNARRLGSEAASPVLDEALKASGMENLSLNDKQLVIQPLASAFLEAGDWQEAIDLFTQAIAHAPAEPLPFLNLGRALALQAETQRLCHVLEVRRHAPGMAAFSIENRQVFERALQDAYQRVPASQAALESAANQEIQRWRVRGRAAFEDIPTAEILSALASLPSDPDNRAAAVAALGRTGNLSAALEMAQSASLEFSQAPQILLQAAFAVLPTQPLQALDFASRGAQMISVRGTTAALFITPLCYAVEAYAALRAGEEPRAAEAMTKAVSFWNDEAAWHALLAELSIKQHSQKELANAANHLELAVSLEPDETQYRIALAEVYLKGNVKPERPAGILKEILKLLPESSRVQALMAESLAKSGDAQAALAYYRKVMESPLAHDPVWQSRLALGMAKIALLQGQPGTAINVLQEASKTAPENLLILQTLCEAYIAAGVTEGALDSARNVLYLAPSNIENILWFANQTAKLQRYSEAVDALTLVARMYPKEMILWLELAKAQFRAGQRFDALLTVEHIRLAPESSIDDLLEVARNLLEQEEPAAAIACLEQARNQYASLTVIETTQLLTMLIKAYQQVGDPNGGLEIAAKLAGLSPESGSTASKLKAELYLQLEKPQEALVCLEEVLTSEPENRSARLQVMEILRLGGDLPGALAQARLLANESAAASFARSLLEMELAYSLTAGWENRLSEDAIAGLTLGCLRAELELASGNETEALATFDLIRPAAAKIQAKIAPALQARIFALRARLIGRGLGGDNPINSFDAAVQILDGKPLAEEEMQALGEAALDLGIWQKAKEYFGRLAEQSPAEPLAYFDLARSLALQAENQRLCQILDVKLHAPGKESLAEQSRVLFESLIHSATQRVCSTSAEKLVERWQARGRAIFEETPSSETLADLEKVAVSPEDFAATINALVRAGRIEEALTLCDKDLNSAAVLVQTALLFLKQKPGQALDMALLALEKVKGRYPIEILYNALVGYIAQRIGDDQVAARTIQKALGMWQDEAAWHTWMANLLLKQHDILNAANHLEMAIKLEPVVVQHRLNLAHTYILAEIQPQRSVEMLRSVLEQAPDNLEAQAMMAEALTLNGETEEALGYFRRVFESPLMNDPVWKVRLSLDLAHTSLKQGEPGTAVAILQEAILADPNDRAVLQTLTRAYSDAGLTSGALETARLVLNLAPADIDNLIWFAEQALSLQSPIEALDALQRAVELRPQERGLYTLLAKSQMRAGQRQEALATFERISSAPNPGLADLLEAASGLLEFNEPGRAIACLERARSELSGLAAGVSPSNAEMLALMTALAKAYQRVGNPQAALDAVEQAMVVMPEASADMYKLKADIYLMLNRDQAALACLEQAIALRPQDSQAHLDAMAFLHREGNLTAALEHARNLTESPAIYRLPAAEFAHLMLDNGLVRLLIGNPHQDAEKNPLQALALLCLAGELDLEDGNPDAAENNIEAMRVMVSENNLEIPAELQMRQAALEARLAMNQKDTKAARQWIQMAEEAASKQESLSLSHKMALAESALELGDWRKAIPLFTQAADNEPAAPLPSLNLARALTLQAETQRLYQAIQIRSRAPGEAALSKENFHIFDAAIRKAAQAVLSGKSGTPQRLEWKSVPQSIQRWWVRGKAAFDANPSQDTLLALSRLPANAEDTSAAIAALGRAGNLSLAAQMGRDYPYDPQVQSQLALALLEKSPNEALEVAIKAVESQLVNGATPQLYALVALAAQRVDDSETCIEAIQKALEDWQDEAGWHDWAAQRFLEQHNALSAAMHLGKAANLEPHHIEHFMGLGKIFMEQNQPSQAVRSLEEAVALDAKRQDAWLLLAKVQLACADFIQAATSADTAIHLKPDDLDAVLIRSEIALKSGEPMVAYKQAKSALHMNQKDAQVFRILSKSLAALNQPDKAMRALEKAAELANEQDVQDVLPLQIERIQLIRQTQGDQAALPQLVSLVEKNPEDAQLLAYYSEVLSAVEQFEPALQAAQMALQYAEAGNQDNQGNQSALTDAQQAELHAMAGRLLRRKGQLDQALHHFVEAMHLNPQQIEIYLDLGMTYQERRQHSEALQIYRNAMQIAPEDARPYYNTALALKESKDYTGAERMLQKAARLAPDDVRIQRLLGSIVAVNLVHGS